MYYMLKLLLTKDLAVIHEYLLAEGTTHLGRGPDNDIRLMDFSISARHAEIRVTANQYLHWFKDIFITDLKSTNGIIKNGTKIKLSRLSHGDTLQIGSLHFTLDCDNEFNLDSTRIYLPDA